MKKCDNCHKREGTKAAIIKGSYYSTICGNCYEELLSDNHVSSGQADYDRGRDTEEHEADLYQPQNPDGTASREFITLYPDTAKKVFTPEEIARALRQ